mgnify:CR=1 FL=1
MDSYNTFFMHFFHGVGLQILDFQPKTISNNKILKYNIYTLYISHFNHASL